MDNKYEGILGTFVIITILLGLIFWALITLPGERKLDFKFPDTLPTQYISIFDWPPQVQIVNQRFTCTEAGLTTGRAGSTTLRSVNGRNYCVTEIVEAAAGSIYTQYAYAFKNNNETVILTFSTRAPQCGNYPEGERTLCEAERAEFNLDSFIDQIVEDAR